MRRIRREMPKRVYDKHFGMYNGEDTTIAVRVDPQYDSV